MSISSKFRSAFRGDVSFITLAREVLRRRRAAARGAVERRDVDVIARTPARLAPRFASMSAGELLVHFRNKPPALFVLDEIGERSKRLFPEETATLIETADRIVNDSVWELAGFGPLQFRGDNVWRRDPLGSKDWGLDYHAEVANPSPDGSDIRVLWELNRFGHAAVLAAAFGITNDEKYAETFFSQVEAWMEQNPYGRGANWSCAMETALRAINVLAAFDVLCRSRACTEDRLAKVLQFSDQHGKFTLDNNEFSYLATSNHYLSNVVGLFWIGTMLPELSHAAKWREFGLSELLGEVDKQVLPDGADFEASTGYHGFVAQMLLYSFLLARKNGFSIDEQHWRRLQSMFDLSHGIIRPDGRMPLIGDADGSQIVPVVKRDSDDAAYMLALAAVVFEAPKYKEFAELTPEMLWLIGEEAVEKFNAMATAATPTGSLAFPDAGAYVLRDGDLYLHLNANDTGIGGRGSHAHNDALSIEVSALGRSFIIDPGSYVYNLDREARHRFRSTAYHSTVMIDGREQNTMLVDLPFILGNDAVPKVLNMTFDDRHDAIEAEHYGYRRQFAVTHRRTVEFDKQEKYWTLEDELAGSGEHRAEFRFCFSDGLEVRPAGSGCIEACDIIKQVGIFLLGPREADDPVLEPLFVSRTYGDKSKAVSVVWTDTGRFPVNKKWVIVPFRFEDRALRLALGERLQNA